MTNKNKLIAKALLLALSLNTIVPVAASFAAEDQPPVSNEDVNVNEVLEAEKTVEDLKEEVKKAEENLDQKENDLQEAKENKETADERVAKAVADLNEKSKEKDEADAALKEAEKNADEASDNVANLEAAQAKKEEAEAKVNQAQTAVENAKAVQTNAANELTKAEEEFTNAQKSLVLFGEALETAEAELKRLKDTNELDETAKAYFDGKDKVDEVEGNLDTALKEKTPLTDDDKQLLQDDEDAIAEFKADADEKNQAFEAIQKTIEDSPKEIEKLNNEKAPIQAEFDKLAEKLKDREYLKNNPQEWRKDKERKDQLQIDLDNKNNEIAAAQEKLDKAKSEEYEAYTAMLDANKVLEDAKRDNNFKQFLDKEAEVSKDILLGKITAENYDETLADLDAKMSDATNRATVAETEISKIKEDISKKQDRIKEIYDYMNSESFQGMLKVDQKNGDNYYKTKEAMEKMLKEIKENEDAIDQLKVDLKNNFEEYDKAKDEEASLLDKTAALENLKEENNDSPTEAIAAVKEKYSELSNLVDAYNNAGEGLEVLKQDYENAKTNLEQTSNLVGENTIKLEEAKKELDRKEEEKNKAQANKTDADTKVKEAEKKLTDAKNAVPKNPTAEELQKAKDDEAVAKADLETAKQSAAAANEAYDRALEEVNEAINAQKTAQSGLAKAQAEKDKAEKEKDAAQKALAEKQNEVLDNEAKEDLEKAKQALENKLQEAKVGADEELLSKLAEIEENLKNENITLPDLIEQNQKLDKALKEAQDRNTDEKNKADALQNSKDALENLINAQLVNWSNTVTSENGADVPNDKEWTTESEAAELEAAIKAAKTVLEKADATKQEFDAAKATLKAAAEKFNTAKTKGSKDPAVLNNAKEDAKTAVDALEDLNNDQKSALKGLIDKAQSEEEIEAIKELANQLNEAQKQADTTSPTNPTDPSTPTSPEESEELKSKKETAKADIDKLANLSKEQKDSLKSLVDSAKSEEYVDKLVDLAKELDEAKKPADNNNPTDPTNPVDPKDPTDPTNPTDPVDPTNPTDPVEKEKAELEEAKNSAKAELDKLTKLTQKDKDYYNELIDKATTKAAIEDVLARANKLETERNRPKDSGIDADYLQQFRANLMNLSKLSYEEVSDFVDRMHASKTNGEIYDIYNEAVELNNSRKEKPTDPVDPVTPEVEKPIIDPVTPKPVAPSVSTETSVVVSKPSSQNETIVVSDEIIYVPKGYDYFKEGFYSREKLTKLYKKLKGAYNESVFKVHVVKYLLEKYPFTVASIEVELRALVLEAEKLQDEALPILNELEKILGLPKTEA